jgi:NAD(P)-dependent dehydrogenase (short-subunit alcohol dehydrogenase family)
MSSQVHCATSPHDQGEITIMAGRVAGLEPAIERHPALGPIFASTPPDVQSAEPADIRDAVLWLASDESRYVTGLEMRVDAGATIR